MSKCRFLLLSTFPQQHFSARTAYSIIKVRMRIVSIQPTTTAIATNNSGDKCSGKEKLCCDEVPKYYSFTQLQIKKMYLLNVSLSYYTYL